MPDAIRGVNTAGPVGAASSVGQTGSAAPTDAAASAASAGATPNLDLADVGQTETLLQSILQAASTVSGIDQAKVAELQQAIASGAYQANPQAIASKFVELENLLATAGAVR
ncbi:MAG TPA: flagellar biosynthesis anti-sigma factor FlgM [Stellaceae bacterium]|jgi:negative regulator of flagellin synthesis FlgM|nr:flagellar biosynthesis anti-sigma factor FlgM [Stellaceae bacterium]